MRTQDYERHFALLEQRWDNRLLDIALATEGNLDDADAWTDKARAAVFDALINDPDWERIEAVDISEIASDFAERAWSQQRTWNQ